MTADQPADRTGVAEVGSSARAAVAAPRVGSNLGGLRPLCLGEGRGRLSRTRLEQHDDDLEVTEVVNPPSATDVGRAVDLRGRFVCRAHVLGGQLLLTGEKGTRCEGRHVDQERRQILRWLPPGGG